jgi:zinc transporter 1
VHELHAWRLSQQKAIASAHVVTNEKEVKGFMRQAKLIGECLHAYGIHSVTVQAESADGGVLGGGEGKKECQISCGSVCEDLTCCG